MSFEEIDPHSQKNGVLINHYKITNTQDLNNMEATASLLAIDKIFSKSLPVVFSVLELKKIHKQIFKEVYPWAGEFRKIDIVKGETFFEEHGNIENKLFVLFKNLNEKNDLKNLNSDDFINSLADFLVKLNQIHPFREGNGRTSRVCASYIAHQAGYHIRWGGVSDSAMTKACKDGLDGNPATMRKLIRIYLEPLIVSPKHTSPKMK